MGVDPLPDDPGVAEMLEWIAQRYEMTKADLARMFQTTQSTIHYWVRTGRISFRNLRKLRSSYYYLHNTRDPHGDERKCEECRRWRQLAGFRPGKAICRECENAKTLRHYRENRESELKRRKAKNWYNKSAGAAAG